MACLSILESISTQSRAIKLTLVDEGERSTEIIICGKTYTKRIPAGSLLNALLVDAKSGAVP